MSELFLKDLNPWIEQLTPGDKIYLIRKVSLHALEMIFDGYLTGTGAAVEVSWVKDKSFTYKLALEKNEVQAIDSSVKHRHEMKTRYEIYEPHRQILMKQWVLFNKKHKSKGKTSVGQAKY